MSESTEDSPIARTVHSRDHGARLDVFLARQPEVRHRGKAKSLIQEGLVNVDGQSCKPGQSVEAGQRIEFTVPPPEPATVEGEVPWPALRVLFEDASVLVIDKQPGIPAHPPDHGRPTAGPDIAHMAVRHCGDLPTLAGEDRPGVVHRLDKETSGVMLLAKTDEAFHFIRSQFKARTVRKEYRALAFGAPRFDSDWIEANIAPHPRHDRMTVVDEGGKEAFTFYEVLERFDGIAYVRCLPRTGRTHQIRVHMAKIGHPLVADRHYRRHRATDALPDGAPDPGRHCLHAYSLTFKHPRTHEDMTCEAPLPADMERLLRWLRRHARSG